MYKTIIIVKDKTKQNKTKQNKTKQTLNNVLQSLL